MGYAVEKIPMLVKLKILFKKRLKIKKIQTRRGDGCSRFRSHRDRNVLTVGIEGRRGTIRAGPVFFGARGKAKIGGP